MCFTIILPLWFTFNTCQVFNTSHLLSNITKAYKLFQTLLCIFNPSEYFKHFKQFQMFSKSFIVEGSEIFQTISNAFKNQKSILIVFLQPIYVSLKMLTSTLGDSTWEKETGWYAKVDYEWSQGSHRAFHHGHQPQELRDGHPCSHGPREWSSLQPVWWQRLGVLDHRLLQQHQ